MTQDLKIDACYQKRLSNGETVDTTTVTLGAGQSQQVSFILSGMDYRPYQVEVAGLSVEFTVSRSINWWLIIGIIVVIGLIAQGVIWDMRKRKALISLKKTWVDGLFFCFLSLGSKKLLLS